MTGSKGAGRIERVLVPAVARGQWEDLRLLLWSLRFYLPGVPVTVAYKGGEPPPGHDDVEWLRQPEDARHFGDACRFLVASAKGADGLLFLNDDSVITPDLGLRVRYDLAALHEKKLPLGLLGLRSNFVAGDQNIRSHGKVRNGMNNPEEEMLTETHVVFGVGFWVSAAVLARIPDDWTRIHWYGDSLLSLDLRKAGFRHFVSRAYLHHVGSRSSGGKEKWLAWHYEALAWLREHRPEAVEKIVPPGMLKTKGTG